MRLNRGLVALPLAALLVLTACGDEPPAVEPTSSPTVDATETPTPIPTPEAPAVKPLESELVLTPNGIGDLAIGSAYPNRDAATSIVVWDDTICDFDDAAYDYAGWLPAYPNTPEGKLPFFPALNGQTRESPVANITVQSTVIRTAEGLGNGSTIAQLTAAYGPKLVVTDLDGIVAYSLPGTVGQLVFWSQYGASIDPVTILPVGTTPTFNFHVTNCA